MMKAAVALLFVAAVLVGCSSSSGEAAAPAGAMPPIEQGKGHVPTNHRGGTGEGK